MPHIDTFRSRFLLCALLVLTLGLRAETSKSEVGKYVEDLCSERISFRDELVELKNSSGKYYYSLSARGGNYLIRGCPNLDQLKIRRPTLTTDYRLYGRNSSNYWEFLWSVAGFVISDYSSTTNIEARASGAGGPLGGFSSQAIAFDLRFLGIPDYWLNWSNKVPAELQWRGIAPVRGRSGFIHQLSVSNLTVEAAVELNDGTNAPVKKREVILFGRRSGLPERLDCYKAAPDGGEDWMYTITLIRPGKKIDAQDDEIFFAEHHVASGAKGITRFINGEKSRVELSDNTSGYVTVLGRTISVSVIRVATWTLLFCVAAAYAWFFIRGHKKHS